MSNSPFSLGGRNYMGTLPYLVQTVIDRIVQNLAWMGNVDVRRGRYAMFRDDICDDNGYYSRKTEVSPGGRVLMLTR